MIIREYDTEFVMIEQDHHAHLSEEIIAHWKDIFFKDDPRLESVMYAVRNHDLGWRSFDLQPFWNDKTHAPYSFMDFPILPKLVLYTKGVDEVEKKDPYAAALCSVHYSAFLSKIPGDDIKEFLVNEEARRKRILDPYSDLTDETFNNHLAILQFADNISLYICLNEPGIIKEKEHRFFKHGIPISIDGVATDLVHAEWIDKQTVELKGLPTVNPFCISLQQKVVDKQMIQKSSLLNGYEETPYEEIKICFKILSK